jgi:hypothetical protein
MNLPIKSSHTSGLLVLLFSPLVFAATKVSVVTGGDPVTLPDNQAETGINISVLGANRVETITYNDGTGDAFVTYTATGRTIFPGSSLLGWSTRTRTPANAEPPWVHAKLLPPAGVSVLWGDPSITSNPGLPNVVLITSLMVPTSKFPTPSIVGSVADDCTPLGGACVARSTDGGATFAFVNCFGDTRAVPGQVCPAPFEQTKGHFLDGSSTAITKVGSTFVGYAGFVDTDLTRESIWKMSDVTSALPFVQDTGRTGTMGNTGDPGAEDDTGLIDTHVRLRADGADLWKMSRDGSQLKVNIHGRNAPFKLVADDHQPLPFSVALLPLLGQPSGVRTGPQFAFDIGVNEDGQKEMRFVYAANDPVTNTSYLQAGYCAIDLSVCQRPAVWKLPAFSKPIEFQPSLKFGVTDSSTGRGVWRMTFMGVTSSGTVGVFTADLVSKSTALTITGITTPQIPCPDLRLETKNDGTVVSNGYWGDYDDMAFDPISKSFVRPFTDSSLGCGLRQALNSSNVHVSTVEMTPPDRMFNVVGTLVKLLDIDNCPPCNSELDNQPIEFHVPVPVDSTTPVSRTYDNCVSHDVKIRIVFTASLSPNDLQTLHVCFSEGLKENSGFLLPNVCDEDVDVGTPICADLAPDGSTTVDDLGLNIPDFATVTWHATLSNTN